MYDKNFDYAIDIVLKHEGGSAISNHSADPGGLTRYGISQRSYPNVNIRNLTLEKAKDIYYRDYWVKGRYNKINHKKLSAKVFDAAVNMGNKQANKLIQRACLTAGKSLVVDGMLGKKSFKAINECDGDLLLAVFKSEMASYYRLLIARRPSLAVFKNGWKKRAYE
jgi:lysozyme family protein